MAGPVFADLTEDAVVNGVPLGGSRRAVTDGDGQIEGITKLVLEADFPGPAAGAITATGVGQHQQTTGLRVRLAIMDFFGS